MTCSACQAPLFAGDVFCVRCGTRVVTPTPAAGGQTRALAALAAVGSEPVGACPGCRAAVAGDDRYCPSCGYALELAPTPALVPERSAQPLAESGGCPSCGEELFPDEIFCVACGARVAANPAKPEAPGVGPEPARAGTRVLAALSAGTTSITPPCPTCAVPTVIGDRFCQHCGTGLGGADVRAAALVCPGCGDSLFADDTFCVGCGTRVGQAAPAPAGTKGKGGTRVMTALAEGRTSIAPPCPQCGSATVPGDAFCAGCGVQVAEPSLRHRTVRLGRPSGAGEAEVVLGRRDAADQAWDEVRRKLERATVGEYDIAQEIGRGGMAAVFLAHDIALNRKIAIKVMAPGLLMGKGMVERFSREAQTVANLSHPNIIQIYTVRHADDLHFFVMKYVEGNSLQSILEATGPLPLEVARQVLFQIGSGLAYAHKRGIVHRDIKPANILIDTDGTAVVMDFGIAKVAEEGGGAQSGMTQAGTVVGTPAYMSPEQCYSAEVTWAADQYSLGVVGYEMLTGRPPFDGTPFEVMQAHTQDEPPRVRPQRSDCPAPVEAALLKMLEKKAADRHATMAAALDALGAEPVPAGDPVHQEMAALARVAVDPSRQGQPQTPRSPVPGVRRQVRKRKRGVPRGVWIAGGAAAIGLAAMVYVLTNGGGAPAGSTDSLPPAGPIVGAVTRLDLSTKRDSVLIGATMALRVTPADSAGRPVPGRPVLWTSSDTTVASVTGQTGEAVVTGRKVGRAIVAAVVDGKQASAEILVTAPKRSAVTVSSPKREVQVGERLTLGALLTDSAGKRDAAATFTWKSASPAIADVDRTGAVVAKAAGRVRISAAAGTLSGFVDLVVKGPVATNITLFAPSGQLTAGRTARIRMQVDWEGGVTGNAAAAQWRTSDPTVATIGTPDSTGATVSLLKEGDVTVTAELGSVRGTAGLQVRGAATVTIDLSKTAVTFETIPDGSPADQAVTVAVRGTEDQLTVGKVEFTGTPGWLTAQLQGSILTLHANPKGLAADSYRASVPVAVGAMTRAVAVTLTITAPTVNAAAEMEATRNELQGVLDRYAKALVSKDSAAIRTVYPGISDRGLQDVLRAKLADGYEIQLRRNAPIDPGAQAGTVQAEVSAGVLTGGGANFQRLTYVFSRSGGGWRIAGVRAIR